MDTHIRTARIAGLFYLGLAITGLDDTVEAWRVETPGVRVALAPGVAEAADGVVVRVGTRVRVAVGGRVGVRVAVPEGVALG